MTQIICSTFCSCLRLKELVCLGKEIDFLFGTWITFMFTFANLIDVMILLMIVGVSFNGFEHYGDEFINTGETALWLSS